MFVYESITLVHLDVTVHPSGEVLSCSPRSLTGPSHIFKPFLVNLLLNWVSVLLRDDMSVHFHIP